MEVVYSNDSDYKTIDKDIIGLKGDLTYLDNYLDIEGISYKDTWTVRRFLNGLRITINPRIKDIFSYLDLDMKYLNTKIKDLSHTKFKYILLAYLLLNNKRFIIFDNFEVSLTYKEQKKFINICKKLKEDGFKILIISSDIVLLSKVANIIYIVEDNDLVFEGTPDELLKRKKFIRDVNIISFIEAANKKDAKLSYTFDRDELLKDIYRSVS